jgi:hypothetical protein
MCFGGTILGRTFSDLVVLQLHLAYLVRVPRHRYGLAQRHRPAGIPIGGIV